VLIRTNLSNEKAQCNEVVFEFYLKSYQQIIESLEESNRIINENFEQTDSMDLDHLWVLALRVVELFEETTTSLYPSKLMGLYL
jgi:hypothetical protein